MKNLIKLQLMLLALLLPATAVAYDFEVTPNSKNVCAEGFEVPVTIETAERISSSTNECITAPAKEDPQPEVTPTPEFVITETEDAIIIDVLGEGEIHVYVFGEEAEFPCTIVKGEEAQEIVVTATAQAEGMEASAAAKKTVVVPAAGEAVNGAYLVLIDQNGKECRYEMTYDEDYGNWYIIKDLTYPWPEVPFYFVVNGVRYGAETDMTLPEMGDTEHTIFNPVYETENYFYVPAQYTYALGLYFFDGELFMAVAQGNKLNYYEYDEIAYDFCVDGLFYSIIDDAQMNKIRVTYEKDHYYVYHNYNDYSSSHSKISNYTGNLIVPETVFYDGVTYSVTEIGDDAFIFCNQLTSITIPNSVTSIGSSAFYGCSGLASVTIPSCITTIGDYAFYGCSGLLSMTIPNSVVSIGYSIFAYCSNLESIVVENNNPYYDSRGNCNAIISSRGELIAGCKNTVIPNTVTSIRGMQLHYEQYDDNGFNNDFYYTGVGVFSGMTIDSIEIPASITSIDHGAFYGSNHCCPLKIVDG